MSPVAIKNKKHTSLILILDHNINSSNIMMKRLTGMGYKVEVYSTWKPLVDYLNGEKAVIPDLILVDIANAVEDLMDLPHLISDLTIWGKTIPMAVHSAISEKSFIMRAIQAGYVDYLVRPMEVEIFADRISQLINRTPVLNDTTFRKPVNLEATLHVKLNVIQINEFGFMAQTSTRYPSDTVFEMTCDLFRELEIESVAVRASEPKIVGHNLFEIHFSYVGIEPHALREIRRFVLKVA